MHRTQISLELDQYEFLTAQARRRGVSAAQIVRDLVTAEMHREGEPGSALEQLIALAESETTEGDETDIARNHDHYLYGAPRE
ncbi:MAG: hypothetical protein U1E45_08750 [Geminicoccaceae bacterium]